MGRQRGCSAERPPEHLPADGAAQGLASETAWSTVALLVDHSSRPALAPHASDPLITAAFMSWPTGHAES